jgi:periplasmic protein TonB
LFNARDAFISFLIHALPVGLWFGFAFVSGLIRSDRVDFEVIDVGAIMQKPVEVSKLTPPQEKKEPTKRAVFGVSRKSNLSENAGLETKSGNTIAKENDDLKLRNDDADALPIPTEEHLVTAMPKLKKEIRIPYPDDARKRGVSGPVVMDLLIDAQGHVRNAGFVSGPDPVLNDAALRAIRDFEFEPAKMDRETVAVRIRYVYRFVLE